MVTILTFIFAFILLISILVAVHESGHAWVAHRLGVKVLRFSIGFGPALWKGHYGKDRTEFVIAAVPLGGYVKMLDEREDEVAPEELPRAFNRQPLKVRTAIVVAGPLFNYLFAILAYSLVYMIGVTGMKAMVGEVTPQSVADLAGFRNGQQIVAVQGQSALRWDSVIQSTLEQLLDENTQITYTVQNPEGHQYDLTLNLQGFTIDDIAKQDFLEKVGMSPLQRSAPLSAVISEVLPDSAAHRAGLQPGDKIVAVDGQEVKDWIQWAEYISKRPETEIQAKIERNHQVMELTIRPDNYQGQGRMGVTHQNEYFVTESYSPWKSVVLGFIRTWDMSVLTLRVMAKMLTLQVSPKNISGPLSIAEYAGKTASLGIAIFLNFLGLVSVSLAVINLMPVPLLDGGHLLTYVIEFVKGSPLTEGTENVLQQLGFALLLSLMGLAIFNDLGRLFGS